jgi:hypothetical protein
MILDGLWELMWNIAWCVPQVLVSFGIENIAMPAVGYFATNAPKTTYISLSIQS